ncbi:hypothetical protein [Caudoviricetes sp.]|nr:hypothetical protein [Caudoviricetes sp.]
MKNLTLILLMTILVPSYDENPVITLAKTSELEPINENCSSMNFLGVWVDPTGHDTFTMDKMCMIKSTSCGYWGSFDFTNDGSPTIGDGTKTYQIEFSINQVEDNVSCLKAGEHECTVMTYDNDDSKIRVSCLNGTFDYTR